MSSVGGTRKVLRTVQSKPHSVNWAGKRFISNPPPPFSPEIVAIGTMVDLWVLSVILAKTMFKSPAATYHAILLFVSINCVRIDVMAIDMEPEGATFRQYRVGDYYRAFQISDDYDKDKVGATFENGLLQVTIPKKESAKPKRMEIKA